MYYLQLQYYYYFIKNRVLLAFNINRNKQILSFKDEGSQVKAEGKTTILFTRRYK